MTRIHAPGVRALAAGLLLAATATAHAQSAGTGKKLYCWTENGHKVCGDALPASAAGRRARSHAR